MTNKRKTDSSSKLTKFDEFTNRRHNIPGGFWLYIIVAAVISLVLLGIYHEFDKIPDGILLSGDTAFQSVDYEAFLAQAENYEASTKEDYQYRYLIQAKKGLEQMLYQELIRNIPEAHIRNLSMEKQLGFQSIRLLWFIIGVLVLLKIVRLILKSKYEKYRFGMNVILLFLICFYIRNQIAVPSGWIPAKLIDLSGWQKNINSYLVHRKGLKVLSGDALYQPEFMTMLLLTILAIGIVLIFIINRKVNKGITGQE